ncbi:MAG: hypothetical protein JXL80_17410 [Planctomycetes bacterium]|nr:hypothetical protein [Planctomycetota bacterium]
MSNQEQSYEGSDAPWTRAEMPCVYCGRLIARDSDRCPECRTSYSLAVRRASREIEGVWFYLEPRNPSNRGVDFATMLKLIEKGRLKADSIVRGPTTHQDWMYAAETPMLSKYLGVCPHCFAAAGVGDEYCPTCHRSLDERPARLRPGVAAVGAAGRFPDRDTVEEQLAASLVTHDMAMAATAATSVTATVGGAGSGYFDAASDSTRVQPAARPRRAAIRELRAKPHIVALLTIVTVVPLFILITYLPLEYVLGDPTRPGSMANNFRENRLSIKAVYPWTSSDKLADTGPDDKALSQMAAAERLDADARFEEAVSIYTELSKVYGDDTAFGRRVRTKLDESQRFLGQQRQERSVVLDQIAEASKALDDGDGQGAREIMDRLTPRQTEVARLAGVDMAALRDRIAAVEQSAVSKERQEKLRAEVQKLVGDAASRESEGDLKAAVAILEDLANKYPREFLPQGYNLDQRIASLKERVDKPIKPQPPKPPSETGKQKAARLWAESEKLHDQGKYDDAIKQLEEIKKLPQGDWPEDVDKRIEYLKKLKWFGR